MIVDIAYIKANCLDNDLYLLSQSDTASVERYENIVSARIFSYIDQSQFLNADGVSYTYPNDLKMVTMNLLQSMYAFNIKNGGSLGMGAMKSISHKFDDYTESTDRAVDASALSFFGIPIDKDSLAIINSYRPIPDTVGMWNVELH